MHFRIGWNRWLALIAVFHGCLACWSPFSTSQLFAQSEANPAYKELPPPGIELAPIQRNDLAIRLHEISVALSDAEQSSADSAAWRNDVVVLTRAVKLALDQNLFFKKNQVGDAHRLLDEAERRIDAAKSGAHGLVLLGFDASQNDQPQPLVGGFTSRIDDSIQPYGIVVPAGFELGASAPASDGSGFRLDVWLHGRGDTKTEVPFLTERMTKLGQYTPANTFVLHPFGRHCNAFKFAGETDVYESIQHTKSLIDVDSRRIAIRGFSMGGAGCWHLAVHDPKNWFAANPGAGFVDTLQYQGWNDKPPFTLDATQQKLLHWYDVLPWVRNLSGTHTIAYSGENDKQKMAADRVVEQANQMGVQLKHVIGSKMGHKIDSESQQKIAQQLSQWSQNLPSSPSRKIDFTTYTLRYAKAEWIEITGMQEHFTEARVQAAINADNESLTVTTSGVTHLKVDFAESRWPMRRGAIDIEIDGTGYHVEDAGNVGGFQCELMKTDDGEWTAVSGHSTDLRKRPGLQGPIDDAFCDRFVIVLPSRPARHGRVQRWIARETEYLKTRWSRLMRGKVNVVLDRDLTQDHFETCHLICFGDFSSNRFLFNISPQLPIKWTREHLRINDQEYDPARHVPVMCFPNPMNPDRYVVINSGMTYREFSNNSNSRQIAMLPDWAVLDVTSTDDSIYAGKVVAKGFFNENWEF